MNLISFITISELGMWHTQKGAISVAPRHHTLCKWNPPDIPSSTTAGNSSDTGHVRFIFASKVCCGYDVVSSSLSKASCGAFHKDR